MKLIGNGIDIVEIKRIKKLMERNTHFRDRVFTEREIAYCEGKRKKYQHYAVRFAAKESVWKALGGTGIGLKAIEVVNTGRGKPRVYLKERRLSRNRKIIISLTHTDSYAVAQAILMGI